MSAYNGTASAGVEVSKNYLLLAPFYDVVTMASPRLNVTSVRPVERHDATPYENAFAVTVTAVAPAAFVWLESQYPGANTLPRFIWHHLLMLKQNGDQMPRQAKVNCNIGKTQEKDVCFVRRSLVGQWLPHVGAIDRTNLLPGHQLTPPRTSRPAPPQYRYYYHPR